ncbi:MAG: B-box zinc finger protein [Alcanivorax sp.]|nr:B-box zinc finger protein [Alcanivorax sp.]
MNHYCKYHPGTAALWYCSHDGLYLCQQCVDGEAGESGGAVRCLLCNQQLQVASDGGRQGALWRRLGSGWALIGQPAMLGALLLWALVAALLPPLWALLPLAVLAGLPLMGLAGVHMAWQGRSRGPGRSRQATPAGWPALLEPANLRLLVLLAMPALLMLGLALAVSVWLSTTAGLLLGASLLLLLPALWLAVLVHGRDPSAYGKALGMLLAAPGDYAVVAAVASVGALLMVLIASALVDMLPRPLAQAGAALLLGGWWLMLAAMCGAMLARHARDWGLGTPVARATEPLEQRRQRVQLSAGAFDKVLNSVARRLNSKHATVADWHRHDRLLAILQRDQERHARGEEYLQALIGAQAWGEALQLLARLRQQQAGWLPPSPALRLALAQGINEREPKLAVQLLKDLHERSPEFDQLGPAYLLLARILAEQFGLAGKAEQYLRFVERQCRDARLRQQIAECRAAWQ